MTRSASQRYTERHKEKDSPRTGRRARRRRRRRRLVRQKGQRVDDTLRALLLRVLSTPHRWCLRFVRLPFPPKVRSFPSSLLLRSRHDSSTDDAAGADQKGAQRVTGFFATGRISGGIFQTGSNRRRDHRATGSPERYVDRHRFVTSLRVRSSQTLDT